MVHVRVFWAQRVCRKVLTGLCSHKRILHEQKGLQGLQVTTSQQQTS